MENFKYIQKQSSRIQPNDPTICFHQWLVRGKSCSVTPVPHWIVLKETQTFKCKYSSTHLWKVRTIKRSWVGNYWLDHLGRLLWKQCEAWVTREKYPIRYTWYLWLFNPEKCVPSTGYMLNIKQANYAIFKAFTVWCSVCQPQHCQHFGQDDS